MSEPAISAAPELDRAFVRIAEGLVHYRHGGEISAVAPYPVIITHPGPKASAFAPLAMEVARSRRVVAPDRLGTADSAPPAVAAPDIVYFADSIVRTMDALDIDIADYFGSHTGAYMGVELLISHPDRFRKVVLDGLAVRPDALRKAMFEHYAPAIVPDDYGRQFTWAFQYVRDQALHFPHFMRDPAHYRHAPMSSAETLHSNAVEILKAITTYHLAYRAVFSHDTAARLALIPENVRPVLMMASVGDDDHEYLDDIARRTPWARKESVPGGWDAPGNVLRAKVICDFFDDPT
jgi:pimeloyl-ACP methyl ester carboxylesterase